MEPKLIATTSPEPGGSALALPAAARTAEMRTLIKTVIRLKAMARLAFALAFFSVIGLFLTYQRFSTLRPIVTVGGQSITKRDYESVLEQKDNGKALHDMVSEALIEQAAAKAGALPAEEDISRRMALIQQRDPRAVQEAEADGSLPLLHDQLHAQIALENLRIQNVFVSNAEVLRYYNAHQADFQEHAQARMTLVVADTAEESEAAADDLRDGIPPDILAEQNGLHVAGHGGYTVNLETPQGHALFTSWKHMRPGEIRTRPLGKQFLVVQMVSAQTAKIIPLRGIQADVARLARLEKAVPAEVELARLYQETPPRFPAEKYARYFDAAAQAGHSP